MPRRPDPDREPYDTFEDFYDDVYERAERRAQRLLRAESRLLEADAGFFAAGVLAELWHGWESTYARRNRRVLWTYVCARLRWRIGEEAVKRWWYSVAEPARLARSATDERDRDAIEAARDYIERQPEPDRSILLNDREAIARHPMSRSTVYRIRAKHYDNVTERDLWGDA